MKRLPSAVEWAHHYVTHVVLPGDHVVDATVGNGHDTLFLARLVGPEGRVDGFDVQLTAIQETRHRLEKNGMAGHCHLHHCGHEHLNQVLPVTSAGRVRAVLFNLGYLPGADKTCITRTETTLAALDQALELLAPGGRLVVVTYPGHPGGDAEADAVAKKLSALPHARWNVQHFRNVNPATRPPECWAVARVT